MFNNPLISFAVSYCFMFIFTFIILIILNRNHFNIVLPDMIVGSLLGYFIVPIIFYLSICTELATVTKFFITGPFKRAFWPIINLYNNTINYITGADLRH